MAIFDAITINIGRIQAPLKADFMRRFCIVSAGDTTITKGTLKAVSIGDYETFLNQGQNETRTWLASFFAMNADKLAYIFETKGNDTSEKLKSLEDFITTGVDVCYKYSLPQALYKDTYFKTLISKYGKESDQVYFSAMQDITQSSDPTQQAEFNSWKSQKAFMSFYPSLTDANFSLDGLASGVMASNHYDLSVVTTMDTLERKKIIGKSLDLSLVTQNKIAESNSCFSSNFGVSNILLNTKYADGTFWHTRYSQDWLVNLIKNNIDAVFFNASNKAGASIPYNEQGIQSLKQSLISSLNQGRELGIINRFGTELDPEGNLLNIGEISSIPFEQYKANNPSDYASGAYNGYSAFIEIQNFIIKVTFNITLG